MIEPTPVPRGEIPLSDGPDVPAAVTAADEILLTVGGLESALSAVDIESFCDAGRLVLAGFAARLDVPFTTIESLQAVLGELVLQQSGSSLVTIGLSCSGEELTLRAGPLSVAPGARRRVERMLEATAHTLVWDDSRYVSVSARMSRPSLGRTTR